jgi:hypothetical protein
VEQDIGLLELGQHLVGIGDEIGREVAPVELHALDDIELGLGGLGFFKDTPPPGIGWNGATERRLW